MNKSNFLKEERKRLGLKQADLIAQAGVNKGTIIRWESGSPIPSDKLNLLAELDFDIQFVVTGIPSSSSLSSDEAEPITMYRAASLEGKGAAIGALKGSQTATKTVTVTADGGYAAGRDMKIESK